MFDNMKLSNSTPMVTIDELVLGDARSAKDLDFRLKDLALFCHVLQKDEIDGLMGGMETKIYRIKS